MTETRDKLAALASCGRASHVPATKHRTIDIFLDGRMIVAALKREYSRSREKPFREYDTSRGAQPAEKIVTTDGSVTAQNDKYDAEEE